MTLQERLSDEADLCRNEGADDIAALLDEAGRAIAAYQWAYEYLQGRMHSIDRHGWAEDCDGEIEHRISAPPPSAPR
jgi:hypothetical protein